jgi:hypothetical protein
VSLKVVCVFLVEVYKRENVNEMTFTWVKLSKQFVM